MDTSQPLISRFRAPVGRRVAWLVVIALVGLVSIYFGRRFTRDVPVTYPDPLEHFKYGSTGGERSSGLPAALWTALPRLFPEYLPKKRFEPGREYEAFGFIYESGKDLPIGTSQRNVMGLPRVFLNCAICHVGSVRFHPEGPRQIVPGMPSNTVDLGAFQRFLFACAADEKFEPNRLLAEISKIESEGGERLDSINRALLQYYGFFFMRQRMLMLRQRFRYMDWEPDFGPGRVDTFTPAKVLLNFPLDKLPERELGGTSDFPSVWLQRKRVGMWLHWDGNNDKVEERNHSAAFGTGAFPPTLDRPSLKRMADWLLDAEPPRFPERIDEALAGRGKPLYELYCESCHGRDGRDFTGKLVGKEVTPLAQIGTDRRRLDSYSYELSVAQNSIYAGYTSAEGNPWGDERFTHFRKTFGYANMPLDGIWLRAPYLHNGSVPNVRELLEPAEKRSRVFYRGYDLYDAENLGFVAQGPDAEREGFKFDTTLKGNGNGGHLYGTTLPESDKKALLEYLKKF